MTAFMDALTAWQRKAEKQMDAVAKESIWGLYQLLTSSAPILTGRFIFNFTLTEGTASTSSNLQYEPSRPGAKLFYREQVDEIVRAGGIFYITNNVEYANWIEYMHPTAAGMTRMAAARWPMIVAAAVLKAQVEGPSLPETPLTTAGEAQ